MREPGHRKQPDSPYPSDRLSRALHRQATVAPPSLVQVTPLASRGKARARLGRPSVADFVRVGWLRSTRSASLLRGGQLQLSLKLEVYPLRNRKAKNALLLLRSIPPIPLKRGLWRPSNITEIMRSIKVALSLVPQSAQLRYCPLRRIISVMCKWPVAMLHKVCCARLGR